MEEFISGYCRCLDKSRMVLVEEGEPDCAFAACPHAASCQIAQRIRQLQESTRGEAPA